MCSRCTGCCGTVVVALEACLHSNSTCCHIAYHHGDKEYRYLVGLLVELCYLSLCEVKSADTYTDYNTYTVRVDILQVAACILKRLLGRIQCELCESVHSAGFLLVYISRRVKILYSAYYLDGKIAGIELVYIAETYLISLYILPELIYILAERVNSTHTRYNYSSAQFKHSLLYILLHHYAAAYLDDLTRNIGRILGS